MLDRALRFIIALTLACFAIELVFGVLSQLVRAVVAGGTTAASRAGGLLHELLVVGLVLILTVGLGVRLIQWGRAAASRGARGRGHGSAEWSGRTLAEDVPTERRRRPRADSRQRE